MFLCNKEIENNPVESHLLDLNEELFPQNLLVKDVEYLFEINFNKMLGDGNFSTVYEGKHKLTGTKLAFKFMKNHINFD